MARRVLRTGLKPYIIAAAGITLEFETRRQHELHRRQLLRQGAGIVTGIALTGCGALDRATGTTAAADPVTAPATRSPRGPVFIDGRRVKTIDVHAHCFVPEALALLGSEASAVMPPVKGVQEHFFVVADRLRAMDAMRNNSHGPQQVNNGVPAITTASTAPTGQSTHRRAGGTNQI